MPSSPDTVRYGIFLRPDAVTCRTTADLHELLRRQFGLVAASVFPPHITLLGNVAVSSGEPELLERIGRIVVATASFGLPNPGPALINGALLCDVHSPGLGVLAQAIGDGTADIHSDSDSDHLASQTRAAPFHGHLTVAGQDLALRPDLADEVAEYVADLAPHYPPVLRGEHVSVFRLHSQRWSALWWQDLTWEHLRTWRLEP